MYIGVVTINVSDQDRAKEFYTKQLGWELVDDESMGESGRWLTVKPPGAQTHALLSPGFGEEDTTPRKAGGMSGLIVEVDDVFKAAEQLKNSGVEFTEDPKVEFFGGWAMFKDSEGNVHGLHSPAPVGARQ
jgi:lactoylglutathione lyase